MHCANFWLGLEIVQLCIVNNEWHDWKFVFCFGSWTYREQWQKVRLTMRRTLCCTQPLMLYTPGMKPKVSNYLKPWYYRIWSVVYMQQPGLPQPVGHEQWFNSHNQTATHHMSVPQTRDSSTGHVYMSLHAKSTNIIACSSCRQWNAANAMFKTHILQSAQ